MSTRGAAQLAALAFASAMSSQSAGQAAEPQAEALMREHKCYLCHANRDRLTGPSFLEISARYRGIPDAAAVIATHMRHGMRGEGPWHMPPHPEISPDEAKVIAQYILSLDQSQRPGAAAPEPAQPFAGIPSGS